MTPENILAFNRLVGIMANDYAQLLIRGEVVAHTDDPSGWRKQMRDTARLDRLKIRTGASTRDPKVVWALRLRDPTALTDDETSSFAILKYQHHVQTIARANGHAFDRWTITHDCQAAGRCAACGARAYIDTTGDTPVVDGEVMDDRCSRG